MRYIQYGFDDLTTTITFNGDLVSAFIIDSDGVYASGHAKRHPEDDFSAEVGGNLALARASGRYARKVERNLIRDTK